MGMTRKRLVWAGVLLAIIALALYSYWGNTQTAEMVKVEPGSISIRVNETGYVQSVNDCEVQALQTGYIVSLESSIGERVQAGQVLLRMNNPDLQLARTSAAAQLAQAQAQLAIAQQAQAGYRIDLETATKELQRTEQLYKSGAATKAEWEGAQSAVQSLQKTIEHQEKYLTDLQEQAALSQQSVAQIDQKSEQLTVVSPVAGTILDLPLKIGAFVNTGTLVAQIGTPEILEVRSDLLGDQMADIAVGQKVYITAAVLGDQVLTGKVRTIRPRAFTKVSALGVEQRRVPVIIALDSTGKLKPGYEVQVSIETAAKQGILTVPRESVQGTAGSENVLLIVNGKIKHQAVKTGLRGQDVIEVLSGLISGDLIVRDASTDLAENIRVKSATVAK